MRAVAFVVVIFLDNLKLCLKTAADKEKNKILSKHFKNKGTNKK